jgi:hypothetical protein
LESWRIKGLHLYTIVLSLSLVFSLSATTN